MSKFGKQLIESMREAAEHARTIVDPTFGPPQRALRVHVVPVPNVRAIRRKLGLSQAEFAQRFRIPLPTLKNWEQGRRQPDAPASAYLQAIARQPDVISDALKLKGRVRHYQPQVTARARRMASHED